MERVEKEYTIIIGGKEVGKYKSDRYYGEFSNPFFANFPEYKGVVEFFNHITCIISDVDLHGYRDFVMDGDKRVDLTYTTLGFKNEESYKSNKAWRTQQRRNQRSS